jgi:predicted acyl esterase
MGVPCHALSVADNIREQAKRECVMGFSVEETVWITLTDGTRLAARVWMPEGQGPFPAVLPPPRRHLAA